MQLTLDRIALRAGSQTHLYPMSLAPVPGAMTVLLGVTLAGKTSLMRIMAGLDRPTEGRVLADGVDVTGVPVRQRNVAMVYQQFINYPSMTVFDNIASPLKLRGASGIADKVGAMAARLHIDHLLARHPSELSVGQQQRVALARALVKDAPLIARAADSRRAPSAKVAVMRTARLVRGSRQRVFTPRSCSRSRARSAAGAGGRCRLRSWRGAGGCARRRCVRRRSSRSPTPAPAAVPG